MVRIKSIARRLTNLTAVLLLASWQVVFAFGPLMQAQSVAAVGFSCVDDTAGANDEPGQKDLTKLCVDYASVAAGTITTTFNLDDIGSNGANTLDACSLFDTDGDGNINYAVCITTQGTPATMQSFSTYSCGDTKIDRCTTPNPAISSGTTVCSVSQQNNDPFPASGNDAPFDTQGTCVIQLSTVGGSAAKLIDVCSFPSVQSNSDPSDCVIAREDFGKVELIKQLDPETDPGLFNLTINGPEANDTTTVNNVGDGGTTGEVVVKKGSVIVSEAAGTNTALTGYATTIVCRNLNGSGTIVGQGTPTGASSRQLTFTLAEDADVVCTVTNTRQTGTVTLVKSVTNNSGGTLGANDFGLTIDGQSVTSGQVVTKPAGVPVTINEAGATGYSFVSVTGTGCPAQLGGTVTPVANQNITCTITNDDQPGTLIVRKVLTTDNGGTETVDDFTYKVNGGPSVAFEADGENQSTVNAGIYTIVEDNNPAYTTTYNNCSNVVVPNGGTATCTIANNDKPATLIVNKVLTQNNGGTDLVTSFSYAINNGTAVPFESDASNSHVVSAGTYNVVETANSGYEASYNNCANIQLQIGQSATCTITNDDIAPKLTVTKVVTNDNGGELIVSDFNLYVDNVQVVSGVQNAYNQGTVTVSEDPEDGYVGTLSGDCDPSTGEVEMVLGGVYNCTITNDDQPGTLIVRKVLTTDNGGTETVDDFTYKVNGGPSVAFEADGENQSTVNAGIYTIVEDNNPAYTTTYNNCSNVVVPNGGTATCTIANNDKPATLIVNKVINNDDGTTKTFSDFRFAISGSATIPYQQWDGDGSVSNSVNAGTYTVTEEEEAGFVTTYSADCTNAVLSVGQTKTCTITNDDVAPVLTLRKVVISADDDRDAADWTLSATPLVGDAVSGNGANGVEDEEVLANTTYTLTEDGPEGSFDASGWVCEGDFTSPGDANNQIQLSEGADVTCTITNTERGTITIVKDAQPDSTQPFTFTGSLGDQENDEGPNFTLVDDGDADGSERRTFTDLKEGTYTVTEPNVRGWTLESVTCEGGSDAGRDQENSRNAVINLSPGENVTCTFVNGRDVADVTVRKETLPLNQPDEFEINLRDSLLDTLVKSSTLTGGQSDTYEVETGSYTLAEENIPAGWELVDVLCVLNDNEEAAFDPREGAFTLEKDDSLDCTFVNNYQLVLNLDKTNNRPDPTVVGDTVTYTLTVSVPARSGISYNTFVVDLPPEGFEYVPGSATATQGALTTTYASPGTWTLGTILPGQSVTLTYRALITSSVQAGTYPDVAFASGCDIPSADCQGGEVVLSNLSRANEPFVDTEVTVNVPQVLGASITRTRTVLIPTGTETTFIQGFAALMLACALVLTARANRTTKGGTK